MTRRSIMTWNGTYRGLHCNVIAILLKRNADRNLFVSRYSTTKLLQILFIRELSRRLKSSSEGSSPSSPPSPYTPVLTLPNPGLCNTTFFRNIRLPTEFNIRTLGATLAYFGQTIMLKLVGRTTEVGARTLVGAACAGKDADGQFMMDGVVRRPLSWVEAEEGKGVQRRVFEEIFDVFKLKGEEQEELLGSMKGGASDYVWEVDLMEP
jgi:hypothetical protein